MIVIGQSSIPDYIGSLLDLLYPALRGRREIKRANDGGSEGARGIGNKKGPQERFYWL